MMPLSTASRLIPRISTVDFITPREHAPWLGGNAAANVRELIGMLQLVLELAWNWLGTGLKNDLPSRSISIEFDSRRREMEEKLREEERKMRRLRFVVDLAQALLMQQPDLTLREAFDIMRDTKKAALALFPDKESVYELIYAPRFRKIIAERFVVSGGLTPQK
jgi:hypothetical protein